MFLSRLRILIVLVVLLPQFGCMSGAGVFVFVPLSVYQIEKVREFKATGKMIHPSEIESLESSSNEKINECEEFRKSLPKNFKQGYLKVPLEPLSTKSLKIFYYGDFDSKPTAFLSGGPALSSHGVHSKFEYKKGMLFFDPRGTGCSTKYPAEMTESSAAQISKYASSAIASDLELLAKNFNIENFVAHSFGGRVVHRMLEKNPSPVKRAISWGGAIITGSDWARLRSLTQEKVSNAYFKAFPDDKERVILLRKFLMNKTFSSPTVVIKGEGLLDGAAYFLGWRDQWATLHDWIQAMVPGETVSKKAVEAFAKYIVIGTVLADGFAEDIITKIDVGGSEKELCQKLGVIQGEGFKLCRLKVSTRTGWDQLLGKVKSIPFNITAIRENAEQVNFQFKLLAGNEDVFTPSESLDYEEKLIPSGIKYIKAMGDHDAFFSNPQLVEFLSE